MIRRILCALCLLLLCANAFAAVSVRMDDGALLLENGGEAIVEYGAYADIVPLGGGLFAAGDAGAYYLMDDRGGIISDRTYDRIRRCGSVLAAEAGGMMGLVDTDGTQLSEFKYEYITADESGIYWALADEGDTAGMQLYILKNDMRETACGIRLLSIGENPYAGLLSVKDANGLYGYIDRSGNMAIAAQYRYAGDFIGGCAVVSVNGKFAAINTSGEYIIPAEYDFMHVSEQGYIIAAQTSRRVAVFDMQGRLIDEYFGENISVAPVGSAYAVCDDISMRVYSAQHEMLLEAPPHASVYAGLGDDLIVSDGTFGEDETRIWGSEAGFQNIRPLGVLDGENIYAVMQLDAVKYENHMLGEIQYSLDISSVRYGAINSEGEILLQPVYLHMETAGEDRLIVKTENQWQLIDISGRIYWSTDIKKQTIGE